MVAEANEKIDSEALVSMSGIIRVSSFLRQRFQNKVMLRLCIALFALFLPKVFLAQANEYFQQDVAYSIHVRLDDQRHQLHGTEKLTYTNNSPESLEVIYMHLWPNAYSSRNTGFGKQKVRNGSSLFYRGVEKRPGFIDSLDFHIDGQAVSHAQYQDNPDIVTIQLPKPLAPGASLELSTPFRVQIPPSYSRLGHIGQQYQITQWYPKPAVFDKNGWHPMPYLDQGEFYSEFGTYDVHITLPKNYVLGATGDMAANDPERAWLKKRESLSRKLLEKPVEQAIFEPEFPENETKTLHFHQENVHDFAWFCDKNYYVLSEKVTLPFSKREVDCVAMFTKLDRDLWTKAPEYIRKSVYDYSYWNGDYPYNHATAVDGALSAGAGMEYPNITVLGAGGSATSLETVTMHEVGHNWFYGILGSNERDHPWMDEGLNTFMEGRYWQKHHQDTLDMIPQQFQDAIGLQLTHTSMSQAAYELSARSGMDQPIEYPSAKYTNMNYGTIVYMKTGLAFEYLKAYLGEDMIDKCFRAYFDKWKFKHPQPEDIQNVFEEVSGEDLDWFFGELLQGTHKIDFAISKVQDNKVTLKNKSGIKLPTSLTLVDDEGNPLKTYWTKPFDDEAVIVLDQEDYQRMELYAGDFVPDIKKRRNFRKKNGLFKSARPLKLNFGYGYPQPDQFNLNLLPAIGGNTTDGFMGGILLHHGQFPTQKFSFHLMPMYGFRSNRVTGSAGFSHRWLPEGTFRKIELKVGGSAFSTLIRSKQSLEFEFRRSDGGAFKHTLGIENHILGYRQDENGPVPEDWYLPVYAALTWESRFSNALTKFAANAEFGGNAADKLFRFLGSSSYQRKLGKKSFVRGRVFAGAVLHEGPTPLLYQLGISGSADRFGEQILFDRAGTSNWLNQQIVSDHGGFSSGLNRYFDQYLTTLNLTFHSRLPLEVFADIGLGGSEAQGSETFYGAGFRIPLLSQLIVVNLPLVGSVYDGLPENFSAFGNAITFTFEPLKVLRNTAGQFIDL